GEGDDIGYGVAPDDLGNVYVTGYINESAGFRTSPLVTNGEVNLAGAGGQDILVAVYNSLTGALIRVDAYGDISEDAGLDIVVDELGTSYVTGYLAGTVSFGNGNSITSTNDIYSDPSQDIFVVSFNSAGVSQWASGAGSSWFDQ